MPVSILLFFNHDSLFVQLHGDPKPLLPVSIHRVGPPLHHNRLKRRNRNALLGPQGPNRGQAQPPPHSRARSQRAVAVGGLRPPPGAALQRVRAGPRLLRRILHDPARAERAVPGGVCDAGDGGARGAAGECSGAELRRIRGVLHGRDGERDGSGGEGGGVWVRGVYGGEGR